LDKLVTADDNKANKRIGFIEGSEGKSDDIYADRIRERREALAMTREQLAEKAGLTYNAIYRIETGQREPMASTLGAIAKALNTRRISTFFDVHGTE
jgi:transcriptional regulator with XRE-family HTH domain